jgi:hypothetical protein
MTVVGGYAFWPFRLPFIKALLLAKLVGGVRPLGRGDGNDRGRWLIAVSVRIMLFFGLQILTSLIDAIIQTSIRGDPVLTAFPHISSGWLPEALATTLILILLLVLVPYQNHRSTLAITDTDTRST